MKSQNNKTFKYGCDPWNTVLVALLYPCFCGLFPCQSYNSIVFNDQKRQIEKYYQGLGIYNCCYRLQTAIPYDEVSGIVPGHFTYRWWTESGIQSAQVYFISINQGSGKAQLIYLPQNACYIQDSQCWKCCVPNKFSVNSLDCCRSRYAELAVQIQTYWNQIKLQNRVQMNSAQNMNM